MNRSRVISKNIRIREWSVFWSRVVYVLWFQRKWSQIVWSVKTINNGIVSTIFKCLLPWKRGKVGQGYKISMGINFHNIFLDQNEFRMLKLLQYWLKITLRAIWDHFHWNQSTFNQCDQNSDRSLILIFLLITRERFIVG